MSANDTRMLRLSSCTANQHRLCAAAVLVVAGLCPMAPASAGDIRASDVAPVVRHARPDGWANFVTGQDGGPIPFRFGGGRTSGDSIDVLRTYGDLFGVVDVDAQLVHVRTRSDAIGHKHTTFRQVHHGVPVFSGLLVVHQRPDGAIVAIHGDYYPLRPTLNTMATVTPEEALAAAGEELADQGFGGESLSAEKTELTIVDPGWYGDLSIGPQLAYHMIVVDAARHVRHGFFVDAHYGEVLDQWDMRCAGRFRMVYDAQHTAAIPGVMARSEGAAPTGNSDVDAAYDYMGDTYDYWRRAFDRDGFDDLGSTMNATVNYVDFICPNAFWDAGWAVFCPDTVTDDAVAHEFTHGVIETTSDLIYQNQPGQLNESFSDVFGELVDLFNGGAENAGDVGSTPWDPHETGPGTDTPNFPRTGCDSGVRWLMVEDASAYGGAIRDMWSPTCYGQPDRANSELQICYGFDNGGVHIGSGVVNHAFAMLVDGKTFNGQRVEPIGAIKAGAIWYRALATYLTPVSDFRDAFHAFVQAATDLVGTDPLDPRTGLPSGEMFSTFDVDQVRAALTAVEMDTPGRCGAADDVLNGETPFVCLSRTTIYREDFEGGVSGWHVANTNPPTPYDWVLTDEPLPFGRAGRAWLAEDRPIGDCAGRDESGVHSLFSPPIVIPEDAAFPMLSFTHFVRTEGRFDGGNVKLRVDGGSWTLVPREAFEFNPYNSRLDSADPQGNTNPLAAQPAFSGYGGPWGTSLVNLAALVGAGDTIELRFDFGKDACRGLAGWYLDDVEVFACPDCDENGEADYGELRFHLTPPPVVPIGIGSSASFVIENLPRAGSDVTFHFTGVGDFSSGADFLIVEVNLLRAGYVFRQRGADCSINPLTDTLIVNRDDFNTVTRLGSATILLKPTGGVNPELCNGESFVTMWMSYLLTAPPRADRSGVERNRYLSINPQNDGRLSALRVTMHDLPTPFEEYNGQVRWVGKPFEVSELSGPIRPGIPVSRAAGLYCEPVFFDWGQAPNEVHVFGDEIIPGASYSVHAFSQVCGNLYLESDAQALIVQTNKWADVVEPFSTQAENQPDMQDVLAILDKFVNLAGAPIIASADLHPSLPDRLVTAADFVLAINAFTGGAYPLAGPRPCPVVTPHLSPPRQPRRR